MKLLLPVGFYLGTSGPNAHAVRDGRESGELSGADFMIWASAHGLPDLVAQRPWTREEVLALPGPAALPDPTGILADLLAEGFLAEVEPADGRTFARTHRVAPLQIGLGNTPENPRVYAVGVPQQEHAPPLPPIPVGEAVHFAWQHFGLPVSLWRVCELLADKSRRGRAPSDVPAEPAAVLTLVLDNLHVLLARSAAFVDTVTFDEAHWPDGRRTATGRRT